MSVEQVIVNPIGWAQIKLLGGPKKILYSAGFYTGVLLIVNVIMYRLLSGTGMTISAFAGGSLRVLLCIQAGFMILGGAGAIRKAIQRDFTTDMITSHRSTAMSGNTAVFGYLFGSTANVLIFSLINWITCTILAVLAGDKPYEPALLFVFLGGTAAMFWTFGMVLALSTRGSASAVGLAVGLGMLMGMNNLFVVCPGLSLLIGAQVVYGFRGAAFPSDVDNSIFVSIVSQLLVGAIFYLAAARKFIRDDIPAFNLPLGLLLLALCSLLSALGLRYWSYPMTNILGNPANDAHLRIQTIVTCGALALVALLPVATAARGSATWAKRTAKDKRYIVRKPRSSYETSFTVSLMIFAILGAIVGTRIMPLFPEDYDKIWQPPLFLFASFWLTLFTAGGLLRFVYSFANKATWYLILFLIVLWVVPPIGDLALEAIQLSSSSAIESAGHAPRSMLFGCSPVGTWILLLTPVQGALMPGLVFQTVVAFASLLLARRAKY